MLLYATRWGVQWWPQSASPSVHESVTSLRESVTERPSTELRIVEYRSIGRRSVSRHSQRNRIVAAIWLLGCVAMWVHVAVAFHLAHAWSHAAAFEHTAQRTRELLGTAYGAGVWFNYGFLAIWTVDAVVCCWAATRKSAVAADFSGSQTSTVTTVVVPHPSHAIQRPNSFAGHLATWQLATWLLPAVQRLAHAYLAFIAINSTIVFETGTVRTVASGVMGLLGLIWLMQQRTPRPMNR